jgi:hypothetical protein
MHIIHSHSVIQFYIICSVYESIGKQTKKQTVKLVVKYTCHMHEAFMY